MDATEKNAKWALEEYKWDSDKAIGMKIRGVRTEMEQEEMMMMMMMMTQR